MQLTSTVAVIAASGFSFVAAQSGASVYSASSQYSAYSQPSAAPTGLPTVDLGYEVHQAIAFNATGQYYNFSNIRYAQPPLGDLRFARPVPPVGRNPVVQNGSQGVICPQAGPVWSLIGVQLATAFANGSLDAWNYSRAREIALAQISAASSTASTPDNRATEDCLFLDVMVPQSVWDGRNMTTMPSMMRKRSMSSNSTGAPVLVWIYGGGYTLGSKSDSGNPAGLIAQSMRGMGSNTTEPIIYVALNYRLGALGWLAGPSVQAEGGVSNAGLYDQRLAIMWVRQNIHLFGGDPNRITLMGESAGGGSIMHQITAFGGYLGVNFQRAIIQSPGWSPINSGYLQDNTTQSFFKHLNVSSLAEARAANSSAVMRANSLQIALSNYGTYTYGPVVDGVFVPAQPGLGFLTGNYAKGVQIMAGHNTNEGVYFAPAYVNTDADVKAWLRSTYPLAAQPVLDYITDVLYPPVYNSTNNSTLNYTSPLTRAMKIVTESIFTCNTNYMARARNGTTYNYEFEIAPAIHGQDVAYTFYNGGSPNPSVNANIARTLQGYEVTFAAKGDPNAPDLPQFPMQGMNSTARMIGLNTSGVSVQIDPTANDRCRWLQKYLYT